MRSGIATTNNESTLKKGFATLLMMGGLFFSLLGQDISRTLQLAENYYQNHNYSAAIKTYQRITFFTEDTLRERIYAHMAHCYLEEKNYKKAGKYFERAQYASSSDSLRYNYLLANVHTQLLQKHFKLALINILGLPDTIPAALLHKKRLYTAIAYYGNHNFKKAKKHFKELLPDTAVYLKKQVESNFKKIQKIERLNPKTARILSMIMPGLGQFYAGDIKAGFNSLILTYGLAALGIYTGYTLSPVDALIAVLPWYARYYSGGVQNAKKIVQQKKKKRLSKVYKNLIQLSTPSK